MTTTVFSDALAYYRAHHAELVERYNGQVVAIKDDQVLGAYPDDLTALIETEKTHEAGTFLLQRVSPDREPRVERVPRALGPPREGKGIMAVDALLEEFRYYRAHQDAFVEKYNGQVVAIKGTDVLGAYDDLLTALTETQKSHEPGTFLLQRVSPGPEAYTVTFHSPVPFRS